MDWMRRARQVGRLGVDRDDILFATVAQAMAGGRLLDHMPYYDQFLHDDDDEFLASVQVAAEKLTKRSEP